MKNPILIILASIHFLILFYPPTAVGQDTDFLIQSLLEHAESRRNQGDLSGALDDYARVLLIDHEQSVALQNIHDLYQSDSLQSNRKMEAMGIVDLLNQIYNLRSRISQLTSNIRHLDPYGIMADEQVNNYQQNDNNLEIIPDENVNAAGILVRALSEDKKNLEQRFQELQMQHAQLIQAQKYVVVTATKIPTSSMNPRASEVSLGNSSILKQQFNQMQLALALAQQELKARQEKIDELSQQIVELSLQVAEKDSAIDRVVNQKDNSDKELIDTKSRFELGRKIIEEKDHQITQLERQVAMAEQRVQEYRQVSDQLIAGNEEKLTELSGILEIYQGKVVDMNQEILQKEQLLLQIQNKYNAIQKRKIQEYRASNPDS